MNTDQQEEHVVFSYDDFQCAPRMLLVTPLTQQEFADNDDVVDNDDTLWLGVVRSNHSSQQYGDSFYQEGQIVFYRLNSAILIHFDGFDDPDSHHLISEANVLGSYDMRVSGEIMKNFECQESEING